MPASTLYPAEGFGVFFRIAFILFLAAALLTGGLYLYRNFLTNDLVRQKGVLQKLEVAFEPSLIRELDRVSNSITSAREILRNHGKTTKIFETLEAKTLPTVSFSTFAYSTEKNTATLTGEAASYSDVSAQSSVFEALDSVESATFGNLALKDTGAVGFNLNIVFKK